MEPGTASFERLPLYLRNFLLSQPDHPFITKLVSLIFTPLYIKVASQSQASYDSSKMISDACNVLYYTSNLLGWLENGNRTTALDTLPPRIATEVARDFGLVSTLTLERLDISYPSSLSRSPSVIVLVPASRRNTPQEAIAYAEDLQQVLEGRILDISTEDILSATTTIGEELDHTGGSGSNEELEASRLVGSGGPETTPQSKDQPIVPDSITPPDPFLIRSNEQLSNLNDADGTTNNLDENTSTHHLDSEAPLLPTLNTTYDLDLDLPTDWPDSPAYSVEPQAVSHTSSLPTFTPFREPGSFVDQAVVGVTDLNTRLTHSRADSPTSNPSPTQISPPASSSTIEIPLNSDPTPAPVVLRGQHRCIRCRDSSREECVINTNWKGKACRWCLGRKQRCMFEGHLEDGHQPQKINSAGDNCTAGTTSSGEGVNTSVSSQASKSRTNPVVVARTGSGTRRARQAEDQTGSGTDEGTEPIVNNLMERLESALSSYQQIPGVSDALGHGSSEDAEELDGRDSKIRRVATLLKEAKGNLGMFHRLNPEV